MGHLAPDFGFNGGGRGGCGGVGVGRGSCEGAGGGGMIFLTRVLNSLLLLALCFVGFISPDIESMIHCQVVLLDSAYINVVLF